MKAEGTLRNLSLKWFVPLTASLMMAATSSGAIVITFDGLADSELVTSQFSGVTFTGASVLTQGVSLSPVYPPVSPSNTVFDITGQMTIALGPSVVDAGGFFTYNTPLTLQYFGGGGALLATLTSSFSQNFTGTGNPPNEFIQFTSPLGIHSMTIIGNPSGNSFTMDNLTYSTGSAVPEPGSTISVLAAFAIPLLRRRSRSSGTLALQH